MITSQTFSIVLCALSFCAGAQIQKKTKFVLCNPMIIAIVLVCGALVLLKLPLETFQKNTSIITMLIQPATVLLSVNIYHQIRVLKKYALPVLVGCTVGSSTSVAGVIALSKLMGLDAVLTASLLPKSCTTPIAIDIAQNGGGIAPIAVVAVMITGLTGALFVPLFAKVFRIKNPIAEGIAIGACSHALGTTKAIEIGQLQGAMSGVAIGICGLMTVIISVFL